jgi:cytochrome c oxidase subunit II
LAPHSPGTDQIDTLLWIGLVAAAIVVVAVNFALFAALRRSRARRAAAEPATAGSQFRVAALLTLFALIVFVVSIVLTDKARETPSSGDAGLAAAKSRPLTVKATGQQWLWRYDYPNGAFSYYKLVVPAETAVALQLESTDVVHTWDVPALGPKADAVPGKVHDVVFRADEEGSYEGSSATLSGQAYAAMRTEVEVVSPEDYEAFVKEQKKEIEEAQQRVVGLIQNGETP